MGLDTHVQIRLRKIKTCWCPNCRVQGLNPNVRSLPVAILEGDSLTPSRSVQLIDDLCPKEIPCSLLLNVC